MDLTQRIQALAQELQDDILSHVIALKPGNVHPCASGNRVPLGMQLNQTLRAATANEYYGEMHVFHLDYDVFGGHGPLHSWLPSIDSKHYMLIRKVHLHRVPRDDRPGYHMTMATTELAITRILFAPYLRHAILRIDWRSTENRPLLGYAEIQPLGDRAFLKHR